MAFITVITIVKNGMPFLKDCIDSVKSQNLKNIEHIIVYSDSKDGTLLYLKKRKKFIIDKNSQNKFGSLNLGIKKSTGNYIGILHSDDLFFSNKTLSNVSKILKKKKPDILYGNLLYVKKNNVSKIIRKWISTKYKKNKILSGWMPPHPTLFVKREILLNNLYSENFPISGDYDFMIRLFKKNLRVYFYNNFITIMRLGGDSNKSIFNILKKMQEDYLILKKNNIKFPLIKLLQKNIIKLGQFF
jgi:glycosyltransferase involved in cell wall biosynthesis